MIKEEMLYGLYAYYINPKTGGKIKDVNDGKFIEIGHKEDLQKKIHEYESSWNVNSQGNTFRFAVKKIGETSWESLEESASEEKPWILQQGEWGEPEFIGWAKTEDEMINKMVKDGTSYLIGENTYLDELTKEDFEYMKEYNELDDSDIERLEEYFEEDLDELPTEVEIEYSSLDAEVLEYYDLEEAIAQYLFKKYHATAKDFGYYWYDVDTLLVHDIKWSINEDFNKDMKFLADDEIEAIDGYQKIIDKVDDKHVAKQLKHIQDEEEAHLNYLNKVQDDKSIDYEHDDDLKEGYKLVRSNKTIEELKSLVDDIYNKLKELSKPDEYKTGGEYWGSTQLYRHHSNVLEIVTDYYHTRSDSYDFDRSWSEGTYCVKIGGAYKYSDYKDLLKPLLDAFNYKVVSGWGTSEDLLVDDTICVLIDDYGSNFSVYGIGFDKNTNNRKVEESIESDFWHLRDLKEPKYGTGNLVIDGDKIRPLTNGELANKFAVSIEHADKGDFKSKKELKDFAKKINAEKIMFYFQPGDNYSGEYSFLISDRGLAKKIKDEYNQNEFAEYDEHGEYSGKKESLEEDIEKYYKITIGKDDDKYQDSYVVKAKDEEEAWQIAKEHAIRKGFKDYDVVDYESEEIDEDIEKSLSLDWLNGNEFDKKITGKLLAKVVPTKEEWNIIKKYGGVHLENYKIEEGEDVSTDVHNSSFSTYTPIHASADVVFEGPENIKKHVEIDFNDYWYNYSANESIEEDIEKHETLNNKIFNTETQEMLPEVREKLLEIANNFVDEVHEDELDLEVEDIVLIGSNANYNYTKDSDLDIHLIASSKPDCNKKHLDKIYQAYKSMFNKNYDITIHGIPTEIYVEMDKVNARSGGIYSVKDNKWLKQPKQFEVPDIDYDAFYKEFKDWEDRYFELVNYIDEYDNASEEVDKYIDDIYEVRKNGIAKGGEFDIANLVFKELRNRGYLDHLKDLKKELQSKEMSLESVDK